MIREPFSVFDEAARRSMCDEAIVWGIFGGQVGSGKAISQGGADNETVAAYAVAVTETVLQGRRRRVVEVCSFEARLSFSDG